MLRTLLVSTILVVMSFVAFALNRDIARLLSGVDQITNYPAYAMANVVNRANQVVQVAFAVVSTAVTIWKPLALGRELLFQTAIWLALVVILASVYVALIDNGDMYPHVNAERLMTNGAIYLLIFIVAGMSRSAPTK